MASQNGPLRIGIGGPVGAGKNDAHRGLSKDFTPLYVYRGHH